MSTCLHLGEEEPHETCMFSVYNLTSQGVSIWKRNGLYMCYPSVRVHLFSSALYVQDHVSVSAAAEYTPAFCIWLTGVTPDCTPWSVIFRTYVQNSVRVSTLILAKKKKGHKTHTQVFASLKCCELLFVLRFSLCVPLTCMCCCVPKAIITLQVHHIPTAWLRLMSVPFQCLPFIL